MELRIDVNESNYEKVKAALDILFSDQVTSTSDVSNISVEAEEIKPKRTRKPKIVEEVEEEEEQEEEEQEEEEQEEEEQEEEEQEEEEQEEEEQEEEEDDGKITIEQVRALVSEKAKKHRDEIKDKLIDLGANNVTALDSADYEEFMDFLNEL